MKTFLTIIITAIIVVALFIWVARYKPSWLIKIEFDKNGFPILKKEGDLFILHNITYWYHKGVWVQLDANGFPIIPAPAINDTFIKNGVSYTFTTTGWILTPVGPGGSSNAQKIDAFSNLPISTIDEINKTSRATGGCVRHPYTDMQGNVGAYYTYNGFEVSYQDCVNHNKA